MKMQELYKLRNSIESYCWDVDRFESIIELAHEGKLKKGHIGCIGTAIVCGHKLNLLRRGEIVIPLELIPVPIKLLPDRDNVLYSYKKLKSILKIMHGNRILFCLEHEFRDGANLIRK